LPIPATSVSGRLMTSRLKSGYAIPPRTFSRSPPSKSPSHSAKTSLKNSNRVGLIRNTSSPTGRSHWRLGNTRTRFSCAPIPVISSASLSWIELPC
jgi:hypothetical protein